MEIVLGLLWIYGIWDGWKQAANIAVKACLAAVLGGLFAVFAVIGLLFKLMKYVAHM